MIIEVNGQQVEVDDSFAKLSPENQQAELQYITQAMSQQAPARGNADYSESMSDKLVNNLVPTIAGGIMGEVAGPVINKGVEAMRQVPSATPRATNAPGGASAGQKWAAKTGFGAGPGQTVEEVSSAYKAQSKPIGSGKISGKIPSNVPMNVDKMLQLDAAKQAEEARRAAALRQAAPPVSKTPVPLQKAGQFIKGATQSGVVPWLGRGLAGAGVGYQGADAYNRLQKGDISGAAISGIGALGSAASFIPSPVTRVGGAAVGIGAEALNAYLDKLKRGEDEDESNIQEKAAGGSVNSPRLKSLSDFLDQLMQQSNAPTAAPAPQGVPQAAPQQGGMALPPELQQAALQRAQQAPGMNAPQGGLPSAPAQAPSPMPQMAKGGKVGALESIVKKMHEVLAKDEGKYLLGTMADRTKATGGFKGGPGFINLHPDYTWAVDAPAVAKKHMEAVERFGGPDRTVMAPMLMSREAHKSNRPVFEQIYNDAQQRIKSGEVTPEQVAALNERIRAEKAVDLSKNPGIENPEFLEFANAFNRRGKLADIMGLKKSGVIDLQKHLDDTIDPALREASTGSVGPQTFTMTGYHNAPGIHPGYNIGFTGEKGSDMFEPAPREFLFRDLEGQAMKQMGRPMTDYNYRNILKEHGGIPNQIIDEKLLRSLQELGYAMGGLVALKDK